MFFWEAANAVRRAMLREDCDEEIAEEAVRGIADLPAIVLPEVQIGLPRTWERFVAGFGYQVSPYDAAYLAVGAATGSEVWTADERLVRTVGAELSWVRSLNEAETDRQ